jgi:hypothetical protein
MPKELSILGAESSDMDESLRMQCDEDCRTAGFGKTERPVGWEGNGEPITMGLVRHCEGKPAATDRLHLPSLNHSFTLDFIITGRSKEILENEVKPLVAAFLKERGLQLSESKTRITHISEGFDFLGLHIRKYNGKFLTKPSRANVQSFLAEIKTTIRKNLHTSVEELIKRHIKVKAAANPYDPAWEPYLCAVSSAIRSATNVAKSLGIFCTHRA